jgi:hypothetical protein
MPDRLARLLVHPLRQLLLLEYARGPDNPAHVAQRVGEPLNLVGYHTGVLLRHGFVELVGTERRHGALTRFYRSAVGPVIEDAQWKALPAPVRRALVLGTLGLITGEARRAALDGGFDHPEAHLTRSPLELDQQGLLDVARHLCDVNDELGRITARSRRRAGDGGRTYEIVALGFGGARGQSTASGPAAKAISTTS